jgi:uncharacterized protein (DUF58 family)
MERGMQADPATPTLAAAPAESDRAVLGVTRAGRLWLLIAFTFVVIGIAKSINLLLLLACCLLAIFVLNTLSAWRQLRGVRARRRLPELLFARTASPVAVDMWNEGRGKAALRLEDCGPEHSMTWFIGWLFRRETRSLRGRVVLPHRGRYTWGRLMAASGYPFGLFERRRAVGDDCESIILPALGWLHRGRFLQRLRGAAVEQEAVRRKPRRHPTAQAEFHGLRPFRLGDSPRLIHWRTSARRGELMTREYEDAPGENLILVFDTSDGRPPIAGAPVEGRGGPESSSSPDARFEALVSLAATACWEWCRRRGDRLIVGVAGPEPVVVDDLASPEHARRALEALALARPSAMSDPAGLLHLLTRRPLLSAALVVVGVAPKRLATAVGQRLRRVPACLDADDVAGHDFYEPPAPPKE